MKLKNSKSRLKHENIEDSLLNHLTKINNIKPNTCQIEAIQLISKEIKKASRHPIIKLFSSPTKNIYLYGSFGVGKSILIKALDFIHPYSVIFHFTDLIFFLQKNHSNQIELLKKFKFTKLILIDEFYINNLTNLIIFEKFFNFILKKNILIIVTSNKEIINIYEDQTNPVLAKNIKQKFSKYFKIYEMKSKIDYRSTKIKSENFFFERLTADTKKKQSNLIKKYSINSIPTVLNLKRCGNKFQLRKFYGNVVDLEFDNFFQKNLVYKDYEIISNNVNFFILRNLKNEDLYFLLMFYMKIKIFFLCQPN